MRPIEGSYGPAPLVAPNRPFAAALAANQPAPSALAPLGHQRALEAPRGLVVGVARPVAGPGNSAALPVRRQHAPIAPPEGAIAETVAQPAGPAESRPRRAPAVAAEPLIAPRQLSRLADGDLGQSARPPVGIVRRPQPPRAGPGRQPEVLAAAAAPVTPPPAVPVAAAPPGAAGAPLTPIAAAFQRPTLGQSRRLGLGAPISQPSVTSQPAAPGAPGAGRSSRSSSAPAPETRSLIPRSPISDPPAAAGQPPAELAKTRSLRHVVGKPVVASAPADATAASPPRPGRTTPAPVRPRSVAPAQPPAARSVGLLGQRPMVSRIQRAPGSAPAAAQKPRPAPEQPGEPLGGTVKVHRGPEAADASAAVGARAFTGGGEIFLPASHGPLSSPQASALLRHELTHVVQQRSFGAGLPMEHTPQGQQLEAQARAAELGSQQPLVLASRDASRDGQQRAQRGTAGGGNQPDIQLAPDDAGQASSPAQPHETAVVQLSTIQRADRSPDDDRAVTATSREPKQRSEQELEELARDLYGRIRHRLSRELIADRERAGMAIDL